MNMTKQEPSKISLGRRLIMPTSAFFKKMRNAGFILAAIATTIMTAPIVLPGVVITIAGYLAVAGAVVSAVSQATVKGE